MIPAFAPLITDAEVICDFMEPKPQLPICSDWWYPSKVGGWLNPQLTLDRLWVVEKKLTDQYRHRYIDRILGRSLRSMIDMQQFDYADSFVDLVNATAEQKIKALAAVIREMRTHERKG